MDENSNDERFRSRYPTRTWRGCCIVPLVAVIGILLLTFAAGLFNRPAPDAQQEDPSSGSPQREAFIAFGKQFFAIAQGADQTNEQGFRELERFSRQQGNADSVKSAFRKAAIANHEAAAKYERLRIPPELAARDKLRVAVEKVGQSFTEREQACEAVIRWADNPDDREIAQEYAQHAQNVNTLTQDGLREFAEAAQANGVTDEDAREFLPQNVQHKATQFRTAPIGGDGQIRKLGDQ